MIGNAPLSIITRVPGWESIKEQYLLLGLAKRVPDNGVIVEIGAEFGMSASIFIYGTNLTHRIFSIDLFPGLLLQSHRANLQEAGLAGRSAQYQGDSAELGRSWKLPIDLLFIDGDHSYRGCKADIEAWIPHLKRYGAVIFHDAAPETNILPHPLHFEVQRAINEWQAVVQWTELPPVDTIRMFVKP